MTLRRAGLLVAALAGCGTTGTTRDARPDEVTLRAATYVAAREVDIVLSERWRREARLTGIRVEEPEEGVTRAHGEARFQLRGLVAEGRESIRVTWLPDHESFLLYARDVATFRREGVYQHGTDAVSAVTLANGQVTILP